MGAVATFVSSGAPAASSADDVHSAPSKEFACGPKDKPKCPLQAWMTANMGASSTDQPDFTALAANFSGASHDITDFANGSEVSTRGTFIEAVNLLNDNVGGVGVSTTINGVLFKGTQPGQFHEGAESFANASFVYHGGDGYAE